MIVNEFTKLVVARKNGQKVTLDSVEYCVKNRLMIGFNNNWNCVAYQPNIYSVLS